MIYKYNYNVHNIFKFTVSSTTKKSLDYWNKEYYFFKTEEDIENPDLKIIIGKFKRPNEDFDILSNGKYFIGDNFSEYYDSYKFVKYHVGIENIDTNTTILYFDGGIFSNRLLQLKLLIPLMRYKLAQKGYAIVKSSSVSDGAFAYIFPAWSGGGKTSVMLYLITQGLNFYSDTFSIVSKESVVYPFPNLIHLFSRNFQSCPFLYKQLKFKNRMLFKMKNLLYNFSLGYINISQYEHATNIYLNRKIEEPKKLHYLIYLTQSNNDKMSIQKNTDEMDVIKKLIQTNKFETDQFNQFAFAYTYKHPKSQLANYWKKEENILLEALESILSYSVKLPKKCGTEEFEEISQLILGQDKLMNKSEG